MQQLLLNLMLAAGLTAGGLRPAPSFRLLDTAGDVHTAAEWSGQKAVVLFFIIHDCPISNSYVPEMNRINTTYRIRGVRVYAVQADIGAPSAVTAEYARQYRFGFPLLLDPRQFLARLTGATVTPQAVVLSPCGEVEYRGRITIASRISVRSGPRQPFTISAMPSMRFLQGINRLYGSRDPLAARSRAPHRNE
jgi:peroxiredoxin